MEFVDIGAIRSYSDNEIISEGKDSFIVQKVMECLRRDGFLQVKNHGIPQDVYSAAFTASRSFFGQSDDQKQRACSKDRARRGFSAMCTENFASLLGQGKQPNDSVEKFRIGPCISEEEKNANPAYYCSKGGRINFFENEWSGTPAGFKERTERYFDCVKALANDLLRVIAVGLDLHPAFFKDCMDKATSILCLNYYPSVSAQPEYSRYGSESANNSSAIRVAAHTDVSMLTIVAQSAPGLEAALETSSSSSTRGGLRSHDNYDQENTWVPIPYCDDGGADSSGTALAPPLIVNIGDCLCDWTGGRLRSTVHRITSPPPVPKPSDISCSISDDCERFSIAFFVSPNHDAVVNNIGSFGFTGEPSQDRVVGEPTILKYSKWRADRISRALKFLKRSS